MAEKPLMVGGQAVLEGVMMRSPGGYAVSVRRANGAISTVDVAYVPLSRRFPILKLPVLRGAVSLIEMMVIGMKSLDFSANEAAADEAAAKNPAPATEAGAERKREIPKSAMIGTVAFSLLIGLTLFVVVPNLSAHFLAKVGSGGQTMYEEHAPVTYNLISGFIRMLIIVGYIWAISFLPDVKRLFQYHGAEHKAVSAFEAGRDLTVENVQPFTRLHPRCGTTFIAITLIVSIVVFAFFAKFLLLVWPAFGDLGFWPRKVLLILGHIVIMPLVAGVCFELLRLGAAKRGNIFLRLLIAPGFWFQRLTTREPDDSMVEVAIAALKAALAIETVSVAENQSSILPAGNQGAEG
ncbi:MAG: DUF1385 domain-containing protein [Candidatus Sumerlaeaceae bacterium]|nr:DUF1385 domain-containing protein [Candidatus Sumerlaeaceae bacterium]